MVIYHWRDEKKIRIVSWLRGPGHSSRARGSLVSHLSQMLHQITARCSPETDKASNTAKTAVCGSSTSSSITALLSSSASPVTCQCSPSVIILELGCEHLNQQQPGAASKRYKYFSDLLNIFTAAGPSPGPGLVSAARRGGRGSEVIKFDHPTIKHLLFKLRGSTAAQRRPPCLALNWRTSTGPGF